MKYQVHPTTFRATLALLAVMAAACLTPVHADTLYWGSDTTLGNTDLAYVNWQDSTHWFTSAEGTTEASAAPSADDNAVFSITSLNGTTLIPRLNANTSINSITFNNTVALILNSFSGNRTLEVGAGGLTHNGTQGVTIGDSGSGKNVFVRIHNSQTWTNNSTANLSMRNNARASDLSTGPLTLTMNAASSGQISNSGAFADGANSTLALVIDSSGTGATVIQSSTHTGGTTVKQGLLQLSGANPAGTEFAAGSGPLVLGDVIGTFNSRINVINSPKVITNLTVSSGSSGSKTLGIGSGGATVEWSGNITLNDSVQIGSYASGGNAPNLNISGVISGAGDLISATISGSRHLNLTLSSSNTYSGDTVINNGAFTLADTGSLTFYIGANGVNNQVTGTSTGLVTFDGTFNFDFSNASLTDGNSWNIVTVTDRAYGESFSLSGFTYNETEDLWINGGWSFSETSGVLTYAIPEPSSYALLAGAGFLTFAAMRRKRRLPAAV